MVMSTFFAARLQGDALLSHNSNPNPIPDYRSLISPRFSTHLRVGVAGQKDLYQYWKENITQCILQDVGDTAREDCSNPQDKKDIPAEQFLVVNVASQEVRAWGQFPFPIVMSEVLQQSRMGDAEAPQA